ncbi:MAG TPA: hypothetical protein VFI73_00635 [Candidatus Nitrosopolaris sp.]|nr:hypothetical protein [Candidatus Nitrosopolaris sp.]
MQETNTALIAQIYAIGLEDGLSEDLFDLIMKKYAECTQKEKRIIARSDEEILEMVKERITTTAGVKLQDE